MIKEVIKMATNVFPFKEAAEFAKMYMEDICPGHIFNADSFELLFRSKGAKFTGDFLDEIANMFYAKLCGSDK